MTFIKSALLLSALFSSSVFAAVRVEGTIVAIDKEAQTYSIKEKSTGELHNFKLANNTKVSVNRKRHSDLSKVEVGDKAVFKQRAKKQKTSTRVSALVQSVDKTNKTITFVNNDSGTVQTMRYSLGRSEDKLQAGKKFVFELSGKNVKTLSSL
ncbi:hypothetical protein [Agaribacterium sp. ZY112]|uniref:hypothetical protein n=1 Tax=Agaribacterium sp. ZY112 TaxID=3233574 RepID=UPI003525C7CC